MGEFTVESPKYEVRFKVQKLFRSTILLQIVALGRPSPKTLVKSRDFAVSAVCSRCRSIKARFSSTETPSFFNNSNYFPNFFNILCQINQINMSNRCMKTKKYEANSQLCKALHRQLYVKYHNQFASLR